MNAKPVFKENLNLETSVWILVLKGVLVAFYFVRIVLRIVLSVKMIRNANCVGEITIYLKKIIGVYWIVLRDIMRGVDFWRGVKNVRWIVFGVKRRGRNVLSVMGNIAFCMMVIVFRIVMEFNRILRIKFWLFIEIWIVILVWLVLKIVWSVWVRDSVWVVGKDCFWSRSRLGMGRGGFVLGIVEISFIRMRGGVRNALVDVWGVLGVR